MSNKHRKNSSRTVRSALLGVTTATAMAATIAVSAPVPTPPALLAQEQHSVSLTAASTPYQQAQNVINTLLPALVNTFGAQPRVTLDTLLAQVPDSLLTDLLNANGNTINVASLLGTLGLNDAGSDLNTAVTAAISSALTDFLTSATTGENATALEAELRAAIAAAVDTQLRAVSVSVKPVSFLPAVTIRLTDVLGSAGVTNLANGVAGTVAGSIVDNLTDILPSADELTAEITAVLPDLLTTLFNNAELADAEGNFQLGNLLELVGLNLASLADSGALSITSAGPLFTLARLLGGVDLGWTPGTQSAIADSINGTGYLNLGTSTLKTNLAAALADSLADGSLAADLGTVLTPALNNIVNQIVDNATETLEADLRSSIQGALSGLNFRVLGVNVPAGNLLFGALSPLIGDLADNLNGQLSGNVAGLVDGLVETGTGSIGDALNEAVNGAIDAIPDQEIASVRIPIVIGSGMGAFSAGAAYRDMLAQLSSQPGGVDYVGENPLLGSLTILPAILLNNAGRANGGIMARFADLFAMLGIDAVTPDVAISSSGGTPIGDTGLALGGANLVPVKIDATVEYQLMSDFAAWANPVTLLNNVVAGLLPTYMLRGVDVTGAAGQLTSELEELVGSLADQNAADTNIYLTVRANSLPMLEPLYLIGDVMRLAGLAPVANLVNGLANALSPALRSLTNLGYSDAFWNPETGAYERTLDSAATRVQFGTLPNVNWGEVLPNVLRQLGSGFRTAMTTNNNTGPNALSSVGDLLNGNIGDVLSGLTGAADDALADVEITADASGDAAGTDAAGEGSAANRSVAADTAPPAQEAVEQPAEPVASEPVEVVEPEVKRLPKTPKRVREAARTAAELAAAKKPAAEKTPKKPDNDQGDSGGADASSEPSGSDSAGGQNAA